MREAGWGEKLSREVLTSSLRLVGADHTGRVVILGSRGPVSLPGASVKGGSGECAGCELAVQPLALRLWVGHHHQ